MRLAIDGVQGVTGIVEAMHRRVAGMASPWRRPGDAGIGVIAQRVYRSLHGTTRLVGQGLDAALAGLEGLPPGKLRGLPETLDGPARDALVAALNGVLGDHLERTANPLAIRMELLRRDDRFPTPPLPLPGPHVLLLVHGLCLGDRQWKRAGHDHGQSLGQELGFSPVYARYNSGLHISGNGRQLALHLEQLLQNWPLPVQTLTLLGHGMGGLVARSAVHQAAQDQMRWPQRLRNLVFLGTPHHGTLPERSGNRLQSALGLTDHTAPFSGLSALGSAGITDLRHGNLLEEDWGGKRLAQEDARGALPLPAGVACYAVAGTLGPSPEAGEEPVHRPGRATAARLLGSQWPGDGLVAVASALGRHDNPARDLHIPPSHTWVGSGLHHLDLLASAQVYQQLRRWLAN